MNPKIKQMIAAALILSLLTIIGLTIFFAVTASPWFWVMLFLMFFFPIFLWAMSFLYKWSKSKEDT